MEDEKSKAEMAKRLAIPVLLDYIATTLPKEIYQKIPYQFATTHLVFPYKEENGCVWVATNDPFDLEPLEELKQMLGSKVKPAFASAEILKSAIHDSYNIESGATTELIAKLAKETQGGGQEEDIEVYDLLSDPQHLPPVVRLLNLYITEAIQQGASDVHFEPSDTGLKVRYRIDGVLQKRHAPAPELQAPLLARIKVMSKMDIAERRLPQDGRIKLKMGRREIDFRVSTAPIVDGERIVLRILDRGNVLVGLNQIGMLPDVLDQFKSLIKLPEGIILVTGPTGSGKTTTLYSAISELADDEINIMTIEDPVEYNLKGIAQIGVQPKIKLDFATGLRHILRQDPDIIMIGEIRDVETANIAIQASLTGHLVLSTLHTNDAPSAVTRLADMGVEPYLLSSTLVGVLAQRLVRRICTECKETYTPDASELTSLGLKETDLHGGVLYKGKGCPACFQSGYRGRHGIYELMLDTSPIKKQILQSADAIEMRRVALASGMKSLLYHGSRLVLDGVTSVAEVLRATRGFVEE
ncbi:MAG: type II secretion system ATPase GspE [Parachlamydiaceae bacterium]